MPTEAGKMRRYLFFYDDCGLADYFVIFAIGACDISERGFGLWGRCKIRQRKFAFRIFVGGNGPAEKGGFRAHGVLRGMQRMVCHNGGLRIVGKYRGRLSEGGGGAGEAKY